MQDALNHYTQQGWPVFPLRPNSKTPATKNGFKDATLNPAPNAFTGRNVGIRTGGGLVVLDPDVKHGKDGFKGLKALQDQLGLLPETLKCRTPSGGEHWYFSVPAGVTLKSSANILGHDGLDIRADGGYVAAAPSVINGIEYEWLNDEPVAQLPEKWIQALTEKPKQKQQANYSGQHDLSELQDALSHIPTDDYDQWIKIGMALHSLGDDGFLLWDTWSRNSENYKPAVMDKHWQSFAGSQVNPGTIFYLAQQSGWQNPKKGKPSTSVSFVSSEPGAFSKKPEPLPDNLPAVDAFDCEWLPDVLANYVADISERMSCPPDFIAMSLLVSVAAVIGRKVGVRPQQYTDWTETCNLWGLCIGRPGTMKSPSMGQALAPLKRLIARAMNEHELAETAHNAQAVENKLRQGAYEAQIKAELKKNPAANLDMSVLSAGEPEPPTPRRYKTEDTTPEALLELLRHNPNGVMVYRDELMGLLKGMERDDRAEQRALFLTGWNGNDPHTTDRIGRGLNLHTEAVCLSVLGGTQPGKIASYVRQAHEGGDNDDGLLQRFQLAVWPDPMSYTEQDRQPDRAIKNAVYDLFDYLDTLQPETVYAQQDTDMDGNPEDLPYLRFTPDALEIFRGWRGKLETRLRGDDLEPALESHFSKYRKLVPALALILHLAARGAGEITDVALLRALCIAQYLETHARRIYASVTMPEVKAAKQILKRIKKHELPASFTARDIYRNGWAGLNTEQTKLGLTLLVDYGWLFEITEKTGGRTKTTYIVNSGDE